MDKLYFIKWIPNSLKRTTKIPLNYGHYPVFQFTQKENHDALRLSQCHKTVFVTESPSALNSSTQIKTVSSKKLETEIQKFLTHTPEERQVHEEKVLKRILGKTTSQESLESAIRIDFYLNFQVVSSSKIIWNITKFKNLPDKTLFLWVSVLRQQDIELVEQKEYPVNLFLASTKKIRYHCIEVKNQLELTCKHKGIIHLMDPNEFIVGCGEIYIDHSKKQAIVNNQSGSLRFEMQQNGYLLYHHISLQWSKFRKSKDPTSLLQQTRIPSILKHEAGTVERDGAWSQWFASRNEEEKQLDCPFLNYVVLLSIEYALGSKYMYQFDRAVKLKKANPVTMQYIRDIILKRPDIKYKLTNLLNTSENKN